MNSDKIMRLAELELNREGIPSSIQNGYLIMEKFIRISIWLQTHKKTMKKFKI
jgi:hypothetical protein